MFYYMHLEKKEKSVQIYLSFEIRTRKSLIFTLKNIFVNKKNTKNLHTTLLDM